MIYGIYQSAAGLQIQDYRHTILANNIANVNTPGFKPDEVAIVERQVEAASHAERSAKNAVLDRMSGGLYETPVYTDFKAGPMEVTDRPFDVALAKDGFFRVRTPQGERFTRDGRLEIRADGTLVTVANGDPILGRDGLPIKIDTESTKPVQITPVGSVQQGGDEVSRLDVVDFKDRRVLRKTGKNLFEASAKPQSIAAELRTGAVEQSGADPIMSMVDMIAATRAYELNATMIQIQDSTLGRAVNDVGRLG